MKQQKDMARMEFVFPDSPSVVDYQLATAIETVRALDRVEAALVGIARQLDQLGAEGLHEIVREGRQQAKGLRAKRLEAARRKA